MAGYARNDRLLVDGSRHLLYSERQVAITIWPKPSDHADLMTS